jgi:hypothetical protein
MLYDAHGHPGVNAVAFEQAVQEQFERILGDELGKPDLGPRLFVCGVSSVAVGGDTVFTKACQALNMLQRVFFTAAARGIRECCRLRGTGLLRGAKGRRQEVIWLLPFSGPLRVRHADSNLVLDVTCFGGIGMRAQREVPSARRTDTRR